MPQTVAGCDLTVLEILSLQRVRNPTHQKISPWKSLSRRVSMTCGVLLSRIHLLPVDKVRVPVLEGIVLKRCADNPSVLLAFGQQQSFAHLPGVGTHWRAFGRTHIQRERRWFLRLLWRVSQPRNPTLKAYLPFPPYLPDDSLDMLKRQWYKSQYESARLPNPSQSD